MVADERFQAYGTEPLNFDERFKVHATKFWALLYSLRLTVRKFGWFKVSEGLRFEVLIHLRLAVCSCISKMCGLRITLLSFWCSKNNLRLTVRSCWVLMCGFRFTVRAK